MAKTPKDYGTGIPIYVIQSLARCMLPDIIAFYESDEGKKEFARWKAEQEQLKSVKRGNYNETV
jgi:hypothetical protein